MNSYWDAQQDKRLWKVCSAQGTAPGKRHTDLQADRHTCLERLPWRINVGVVTSNYIPEKRDI